MGAGTAGAGRAVGGARGGGSARPVRGGGGREGGEGPGRAAPAGVGAEGQQLRGVGVWGGQPGGRLRSSEARSRGSPRMGGGGGRRRRRGRGELGGLALPGEPSERGVRAGGSDPLTSSVRPRPRGAGRSSARVAQQPGAARSPRAFLLSKMSPPARRPALPQQPGGQSAASVPGADASRARSRAPGPGPRPARCGRRLRRCARGRGRLGWPGPLPPQDASGNEAAPASPRSSVFSSRHLRRSRSPETTPSPHVGSCFLISVHNTCYSGFNPFSTLWYNSFLVYTPNVFEAIDSNCQATLSETRLHRKPWLTQLRCAMYTTLLWLLTVSNVAPCRFFPFIKRSLDTLVTKKI